MTMDWQTIQIPLSSGLVQKTDDRALNPPALAKAYDCIFDEIGGVQTRPPYVTLANKIDDGINGNGIAGDGTSGLTSLTGVRRVSANGDELLVWTKDHLYAYQASSGAVVDRGEHLAIATDETPVFETTSDQVYCDRAELDGIVYVCWRDEADPTNASPTGGTAEASGDVYVAAYDKTTGAVTLAPYKLANEARPRLVALSTAIILLTINATSGDFLARELVPSRPAQTIANAPTTVKAAGTLGVSPGPIVFDAVRIASQDKLCYVLSRPSKTAYTVGTLTSTLVATQADKTRNSDASVAIAADPTGTYVQVIRCDASAIKGDLLTVSGFTDTHTAQAIGTAETAAVSQIAIAYNDTSIGGGDYRAYVWWSSHEYEYTDSFVVGAIKKNDVDVSGALGTQAIVMPALTIGSRAFSHDNHVYVHFAFAQPTRVSRGVFAQLQNTYFLYRDDDRLCGQAVVDAAGAALLDESASGSLTTARFGHLPGVVLVATNTYAWCGSRRRRIAIGTTLDHDYSARSPTDITFVFDDNRARRCVRLGRTLYVTGNEIMQYDGQALNELGFHIYPWKIFVSPDVPGGAAIPDGDYTYKGTYRWDNAAGERERSTTATYLTMTAAGGPSTIAVTIPDLNVTHKTSTKAPVVLETWRTQKNPANGAPMYLINSLDPADARSSLNRFAANIIGGQANSVTDNLTDTLLTEREENDEVGSELESLSPPPANIIAASQNRVFLAGVAGDPHRVWYSKLRSDGQLVAFNDALTIDIPPAGGDITALAILSETLVVFREHATYVIPGEGFDNQGGGSNYGPARIVSADCGAVSAESVALIPMGLIFKSVKGWYLCSPGWQAQYIGGSVSDFDSEAVQAVHVLEQQHHVRILTSSRMLVWDYLMNQWSEWTSTANGTGACVWQGRHVYWDDGNSVLLAEQTAPASYSSPGYGIDVETPWIKMSDLAGRGRVRWALVTGEYRSAHSIRIRVARDYAVDSGGNPAWFDDAVWTPSGLNVGQGEQVRHGPSIQQCEAIKIRITAVSNSNSANPPAGEAVKLTGIALEVGAKRGAFRNLAAAQKG